jgi:hypothetical protein
LLALTNGGGKKFHEEIVFISLDHAETKGRTHDRMGPAFG